MILYTCMCMYMYTFLVNCMCLNGIFVTIICYDIDFFNIYNTYEWDRNYWNPIVNGSFLTCFKGLVLESKVAQCLHLTIWVFENWPWCETNAYNGMIVKSNKNPGQIKLWPSKVDLLLMQTRSLVIQRFTCVSRCYLCFLCPYKWKGGKELVPYLRKSV